jgi:hypothetical protein
MSNDDQQHQYQHQIFGFYDWAIIHAYTRADALRDGELVAADPELLQQAGFRWPLAYTRSVFVSCIDRTGTNEHHADRHNREQAILTALHTAIRAHTNPDDRTLAFTVRLTPRVGDEQQITLYAGFGPGDNAEPVITVLSDLTEL